MGLAVATTTLRVSRFNDAAFFRIARNDGRLMTRAPLDYEIKNTFTVVVTATDPFGAADSIVVTINVTDEDDPAVITIAE